MNNKIFDIVVNFEGVDSIASNPIKIFQGDYNSIEFDFTLSKTDYASAMFYMVKPSGSHFAMELDANQKVVFTDSSAFDEAGTYVFSIALYDSDSRLTNTAKGKLKVIENDLPTDDEVTAEANYLVLDQLINRTNAIMQEYSDMASSIQEYNDNATQKTNAFNSNYTEKLDNINANILQVEEDAETHTGITFSEYADAKRLENHIENHFALTVDENTYGVDFPMWETSQSSAGTKTDANAGLVCTPGTDTIKAVDTYPEAWNTYDVNAEVDANGVRHITGIKGVDNYHDVGKYNCFVLKRTYWQKIYVENGYLKIRRRFVPTEGYDICPLAINKDGTYNSWFVVPKYFAGDIDGKLYMSKGLIPAHYLNMGSGENPSEEEFSDNVCYNGLVNLARTSGGNNYYSGGLIQEWYDFLTTFYLKTATRNSQSIVAGNTSNSGQYQVTTAEASVRRVIIATSNANNIDVNTYVSIGELGSGTDKDRAKAHVHNVVYDAKVVSKEVVDASNTALVLDHAPFTTTTTCWVSTMHERAGFSDCVLGRFGSIGSNTNGRHGFVFDGVEYGVGGYEVLGNAFMDIINASGDREVYYTNDATKITSTIATAKANYSKSSAKMTATGLNAWKYITEFEFDTADGVVFPTKAGQSGSGSSTGYADGVYFDTATSGQREFLLLGNLYNGAYAGASYVYAAGTLGAAHWFILARLSINGVGGELA